MEQSEASSVERHRARYEALKSVQQSPGSQRIENGSPLGVAFFAPSGLAAADRVPGGWFSALRLKRGDLLRITAPEGRASASALFWNAQDVSERLCVGDSMKIQWRADLGAGRLLFSDMGRPLLSIVDDSGAGHDALAGCSDPASTRARYGRADLRNGRDNLRLAAARFGLGRRDVGPCFTFFAPIAVDARGGFQWRAPSPPPGSFVTLRAEMDLMAALSNTPHPLDPHDQYAPGPIETLIWAGPTPTPGDPCRTAGDEARRAFENSMIEFEACYDQILPARRPWTRVLRRGQVLRLIDLEGRQAVDALFYRADDPAERYCAQTTLRAQNNAYLSQGSRLLSNDGGAMLTLIADTCGGHDTSAGCCSAESNGVRFGRETRFQPSCRDNFLMALGDHGLGKRDIVSNVNFFMNVPVEPDGALAIVDGVSKPGDYVDLRAEMDVLCAFSNCPQINNPCNDFNPTPVRVIIWEA